MCNPKSCMGTYQSSGITRFNPTNLGSDRRQFKAQQNLRKHLLPRQPAQHLIQITHRDLAPRLGIRRAALELSPASGLRPGKLSAGGGSTSFNPPASNFPASCRSCHPSRSSLPVAPPESVRRMHQFQILQVIRRCLRSRLRDHVRCWLCDASPNLSKVAKK